ncbi:MAG: hypothetical protein WAV95_17520 [Azonexus sp.]
MKLNRLESTTRKHSSQAVERLPQGAAEQVRRVEAAEGVEADRQRSLQQELAEFDPRAVGPFEGGERLLQEAREVAAQLTLLGAAADAMLNLGPAARAFCQVDDKA